MPEPEILAAGAVVSRKGPDVLLVHRPKYDDWSFPKGKLDPGEHETAAAVREVAEETGLDVRLGPPLQPQHYAVAAGRKVVHYWVGRLVGGDDVSAYRPNNEIDEVAWVPLSKADRVLTYRRDRETLAEFAKARRKSTPLLVLRHAKARPRKSWDGEDPERPLTADGELQAEQVVPLLAAYGVRQVVSSSSRRCWTSVAPYADVADLDVAVTEDLSEEGATERKVERVVHQVLAGTTPTVLCTHRPVLPLVQAALGVPERKLEVGSMLVVHHRRGQMLAVEHHQAPGGTPA
jgi:8-oxo-dGTP pyrophosphatase MutT (NUDIX family)/phosphohistidine phosphatase SixA